MAEILVTTSNSFLTKLVTPTIIRSGASLGGADDLPHAHRRVPRLRSTNTPDLQPPPPHAAERRGPGNGRRGDPVLDRHPGRGAPDPTRTVHSTDSRSPRGNPGRTHPYRRSKEAPDRARRRAFPRSVTISARANHASGLFARPPTGQCRPRAARS